MIRIVKTGECGEMCGGMAYRGYAEFDGKTVREVLDEIREYARTGACKPTKNGWGNPEWEYKPCGGWSVSVDGKLVASGWANRWEPEYDGSKDNAKVKRISIYGGWYCDYDFNIVTKGDE